MAAGLQGVSTERSSGTWAPQALLDRLRRLAWMSRVLACKARCHQFILPWTAFSNLCMSLVNPTTEPNTSVLWCGLSAAQTPPTLAVSRRDVGPEHRRSRSPQPARVRRARPERRGVPRSTISALLGINRLSFRTWMYTSAVCFSPGAVLAAGCIETEQQGFGNFWAETD
jgi:hypothetical protein